MAEVKGGWHQAEDGEHYWSTDAANADFAAAARERRDGNYELTAEQREAVERRGAAGGVVAYIRRLTDGHRFTFYKRDDGTLGVSGCVCGDTFCHNQYLALYRSDMIAAYENEVADLAQETLRSSALAAQVEALESERSVLAAKIEAARELIGRALLMHAAKAQPVDWQRWGRDVEAFSSSFPREPDDIDALRALAATEETE